MHCNVLGLGSVVENDCRYEIWQPQAHLEDMGP